MSKAKKPAAREEKREKLTGFDAKIIWFKNFFTIRYKNPTSYDNCA